MVSSKGHSILRELSSFSLGLKSYEAYRVTSATKGITKEQTREMMSLRERLVRESGKFGPLIKELTGKERIFTIGKGDEYSYDMWGIALRLKFHSRSLDALRICIDYTDRAIGKLEADINEGARDKQGKKIGEPLEHPIESPLQIFDAMQFHPKIIQASKSLYENKYYAQAIFEAFKAVENFVQDKSDLTLYGTNLMERVFNEENPIIKVPEAGHYYKDVQRGFKHLFIGAAQAIRNPKAHKEIIQKDSYITLEYLGFASFLLKRIDYWEAGIS